MEEFIEKLNKLFDEDLFGTDFEEDLMYEANELLICDHGCDWGNIFILRDHNFRVFPGDRDSFGWLTGCIQRKGQNKIFMFG